MKLEEIEGSPTPPTDHGHTTQGFWSQLDEFYFTTTEKKIVENYRWIVQNFINDYFIWIQPTVGPSFITLVPTSFIPPDPEFLHHKVFPPSWWCPFGNTIEFLVTITWPSVGVLLVVWISQFDTWGKSKKQTGPGLGGLIGHRFSKWTPVRSYRSNGLVTVENTIKTTLIEEDLVCVSFLLVLKVD